MRAQASIFSALILSAVALVARSAAADNMDPALNRLVSTTGCRTSGPEGGVYYNPQSGFARCEPDNQKWANLVAQYGFALAPTAMHAARTTGWGGFELGVETAFTVIDKDKDYWREGTQGPQDPISKNFSVVGDPDDFVGVYMLKLRKGFILPAIPPWGWEITGNVGFVGNTGMIVGGADVRLSLFEGFRTGVPAIFPELTVGASVRTMTGTEQMQLTIFGAEGTLSKPFAIAGTVVFTPYVGYQYLRIFGDSGLIDVTPNTDPINYCDFNGTNTPATPDPTKNALDGQPVCGNGTSADFNNNIVFTPVRLNRHRLGGGFNLRFQLLHFGAHFISDIVDVKDANQDVTTDEEGYNFDNVSRQWTLAFSLGAILN